MPRDLFLAWIRREWYNPSPLWSIFHQAKFTLSCKPFFPFWCDLKKKKMYNLNCYRKFSSVWKQQWANILGTVAVRKKKKLWNKEKSKDFLVGGKRLFTQSPGFLAFFLRKGKKTRFRKKLNVQKGVKWDGVSISLVLTLLKSQLT